MERLRGFPRRFRFPWRSTAQIRRDVDDEIAFHLAEKTEALQREGLSIREARDEALRQFGDLDTARARIAKDDRRGERRSLRLMTLEDFVRDTRHAWRSLRRNPGFTAAAIVTVALGVGVNAGVFTVLNGVLFRDLPAPEAHELLSIRQTVEGWEYTARSGGTFSVADYHAYRDSAQAFSGILAHAYAATATLGGESPREVFRMSVSCNYFTVLRQPPALGRGLNRRDCEPRADRVVVLGHELWTTAFAADPDILGSTIHLDRQPFTVVGVAARGTYGASPLRIGYFAPISAETSYEDDTILWLHLIGRRQEDVGLEQVRAELGVIAGQIDQQHPGRSTTLSIDRATPMTIPVGFRGVAIGAAGVLMVAFGLILLIACANVANLLLARGSARSHEIGIRLSLGASRARVVRQLLTESMLIALAGGLFGCVLALWSFQALVALALPAVLPAEVPAFVWDLSPDFRVLWFAAALTFGTGLLFGLAPALHASKPDLHSVIKHDTAGSRGGGRLRGMLVGVQVAMCMALMIAAGLLLRGLYMTYATDLGFAYRNVTTVSFALQGGYDREQFASLAQRFKDQVRALPGVDKVAYATLAPLGTAEFFTVRMRLPSQSENEFLPVRLNNIGRDYFAVLEIPIVRGRNFTEAEIANVGTGVRPAIVSETTARNLWPEGDAVGRTLLSGNSALRVVGVAADAQVTVIGKTDPYYVYEPARTGQVLLVKSRADFETTASGIRAALRGLDPALAVRVLPLEANLGWWRSVSAAFAALSAGLGALALVLASVGIYGVVSYSVVRRYREIGVRMALGARARDVLGMILRQTMRPVVVGAVIGAAAAIALSDVLSSVLFGVGSSDPIGLGGGVLLVLCVAILAAIMAVRAATRIDLTAALRYE